MLDETHPRRGRTRRHPARLLPLRCDHVDASGKVSIRRAGRIHHLGIRAAQRGQEIPAITDMTSVTVIELRTGEVLSAHDTDPTRAYWRNKRRNPGPWPGLPVP